MKNDLIPRILNISLWADYAPFHVRVIFGLGSDCLFKSKLGRCVVVILSFTLRFFFKFVSLANNSKTYQPNEFSRKQKMFSLKSY